MPASKKGSKCGSQHGGDDDDDAVDISKDALLATLIIMVIGAGVKCKECKLCKAKSTDPTPLVVPEGAPEGSQFWPWLHYTPHPDHPGYKVPLGRLCQICMNIFRSAGHTFVAFVITSCVV